MYVVPYDRRLAFPKSPGDQASPNIQEQYLAMVEYLLQEGEFVSSGDTSSDFMLIFPCATRSSR